MPRKVIHKTKATTTLHEVMVQFVNVKLWQGRSQSTVDNYCDSFELFCKELGINAETAPPSILKKDLIYDWIDKMSERGLSPASINHYLGDMRAICYYIQKENLCDQFKIELVKAQEVEPKTYSDGDVDLLLAKPKNEDDFCEVRTWVICNLVCGCGARASSVCSLRVGSIDFNAGLIRFPHTKSKRALSVPLSKQLTPILRQYIREWRSGCDESDWLFPSVSDGQLTTNALRLSYERYCKDRGVSKTSIHSLRHSFAKAWIVAGGSPFQLQAILGHSDVAMTKRYVALFGEDLKEGYEEFSLLDRKGDKTTRRQTVRRTHQSNFHYAVSPT